MGAGPRVLVDVAETSTAATVLGHDVSLPLLVAPVAFLRTAHADGELGLARAARDVGTIRPGAVSLTVTRHPVTPVTDHRRTRFVAGLPGHKQPVTYSRHPKAENAQACVQSLAVSRNPASRTQIPAIPFC